MNKKRLSIILTVFFLVQGVVTPQFLSAETFSLNPPTKVSLNQPQICIEKISDTLCLALLMYKLDVLQGQSKDVIKTKYGAFISAFPDVQFDLDEMDIGKKGCTRYYPFWIDGKDFIFRLFLTSEVIMRSREIPADQVLYEGTIMDGKITFQILPGVKQISKDCKTVKFREPHPIHEVDSSS